MRGAARGRGVVARLERWCICNRPGRDESRPYLLRRIHRAPFFTPPLHITHYGAMNFAHTVATQPVGGGGGKPKRSFGSRSRKPPQWAATWNDLSRPRHFRRNHRFFRRRPCRAHSPSHFVTAPSERGPKVSLPLRGRAEAERRSIASPAVAGSRFSGDVEARRSRDGGRVWRVGGIFGGEV